MDRRLTAHDKDIREPLFEFLEERYGKVRILEEKRTGRARADIVMIRPGSIWGIEIKSDHDTYARLAGQVKNYDLYYDYNMVVVGSSHAARVGEHVPDWWGIISAEDCAGGIDFYVVREPSPNPHVLPERKISILWRPELARIQEQNRLPAYKGKSKAYVRKVILDRVPAQILWDQVSEELFERDYNTIAQEIRAYKRKR